MKIEYDYEVYYFRDCDVKMNVLGLVLDDDVRSSMFVRSGKSVSNVILNMVSLYLNGDYLKGGRM